ncbi:MAG: hypothetical protein HRT77_09230 [Halioglobus sp.]|nr:hypothetical protein [Halioglobus sp.]
MKRLDDGKVSLVEFLRSIKSVQRSRSTGNVGCATHFAGLDPHARAEQKSNPEDLSLVRSDN